MIKLTRLHAEVEARVQSIRANRLDWPCGEGCDSCCRQLAEVPQLTVAEWELLQEGLAALPAGQLQVIGQEISKLARSHTRPVVCPLLDRVSAACTVYAHRPIACRTYGFYVQRDKGLYCSDIESRVSAGGLTDVVWGNHDAIDHDLLDLGETRSLSEWFERCQRRYPK